MHRYTYVTFNLKGSIHPCTFICREKEVTLEIPDWSMDIHPREKALIHRYDIFRDFCKDVETIQNQKVEDNYGCKSKTARDIIFNGFERIGTYDVFACIYVEKNGGYVEVLWSDRSIRGEIESIQTVIVDENVLYDENGRMFIDVLDTEDDFKNVLRLQTDDAKVMYKACKEMDYIVGIANGMIFEKHKEESEEWTPWRQRELEQLFESLHLKIGGETDG